MQILKAKVNSDIGIKGKLAVVITNEDGKQERYDLGHNTACQSYLNAIASWTAGLNNTGQSPISPPTQFELGTGMGTPKVSDSGLFIPAIGTLTNINTRTPISNTVVLTTNYLTGQLNGTYTEAGLFDASGNIMNHLVFASSISIANTQAATFIWTNTINAG